MTFRTDLDAQHESNCLKLHWNAGWSVSLKVKLDSTMCGSPLLLRNTAPQESYPFAEMSGKESSVHITGKPSDIKSLQEEHKEHVEQEVPIGINSLAIVYVQKLNGAHLSFAMLVCMCMPATLLA